MRSKRVNPGAGSVSGLVRQPTPAASMNAVAETTGGRVFDSRATALSQVFKQIRGYQ